MALVQSYIDDILNKFSDTDARAVVDYYSDTEWYVGLTINHKALKTDPKWMIYQLLNSGKEIDVNSCCDDYIMKWSDRLTMSYGPLSDIKLNTSVIDDTSTGFVVGTISNVGGINPVSFSIETDADNKFEVVDKSLKLKNEVTNGDVHLVTIKATDADGSTLLVEFELLVDAFASKYCLTFDNVSEKVDFGSVAALPSLNNFSMFMWQKSIPTGSHFPFRIFDIGTNKYCMYISTIGGDRVAFTISEDGGYSSGKSQLITLSGVHNGSWRSFGMSYDSVEDVFNVYIDGVKMVANYQWENPMSGIYQASGNVVLGEAFGGEIDDTTIFNTVKTDVDFEKFHNGGVPLEMHKETNVVFNSYLGDDCILDVQYSTNGSDGTMSAMSEAENKVLR